LEERVIFGLGVVSSSPALASLLGMESAMERTGEDRKGQDRKGKKGSIP